MPAEQLIRISEVKKSFRMGDENLQVLKGIELNIQAGEMLGLIGPSGCGKTTLMNILGLLDRPTSGEYLLQGRGTQGLSDSEAASLRNEKIGFVFQSFHLLPRATALANVAMPLIYSGLAVAQGRGRREWREQRAMECLTMVGLSDRAGHLPNELSGGQRQRVAIARALVNRPPVIFADEPTGNLDSRVGREIMDLFFELNRMGTTIVIVTHDRELAARLPRTVEMKDGMIVKDSYATH